MTATLPTPRTPAPGPGPAHSVARGPVKRRLAQVLTLVCLLAGVAMLLYPVVGTMYSNISQSRQADVAVSSLREFAPEEINEELARAAVWNETHRDGPILDPWLARISHDNPDYQDYLAQLNLTEAMGRVIVPSINSSLPIYHGTDEATLLKGIGHLYGSSLPIGGANTHAVLTGHTGLSQSTLWDNLVDVRIGDGIYLETYGQRMKYEVSDIEVVLPEETEGLRTVPGEDLISLITCTPYGINSHRLVVHAHRVPLDDESVFTQTYLPWQWWMTAVLVVLGLLVLLALATWLRSRRKKARNADILV